MKEKGVKKILKEQILLVKPSDETLRKINKIYKEFSKELIERLKKKRIKADVFLGGSLAKDTLVKKDLYDIDIFVRFDLKYDDKDISKLLGKVMHDAKKIHGSRDYFQITKEGILIEVIPTLKIKRPEEAENVTDLSYFHVNYVRKKIHKNKKLADEIILAKNFTHAQHVYGAESYIKGFSGYALELLVLHYGSFLKFIDSIAKHNPDEDGKLVIDDSKFYKNREEVLMMINASKKISPIILIDPTFEQRNSLSGLSRVSYFNFQRSCRNFLKKPSSDFFVRREISEQFRIHKNYSVIKVKTNKQPGDISGTKSKKFFSFVEREIRREFDLRKSGFEYIESENIARFYFVVSKKKDELIKGPSIANLKNLERFKKVHKEHKIKSGYIYAKVKHEMKFDEWFEIFLKKDKKVMRDMGIVSVENVV